MIFRNCPFFPHHLTPPPKNGFWGAQTDTKNLLIGLKPLHIGHWRYPESLNTFKIFDPNPLVAWSWSASLKFCCNISSSIQRKINRHIPSILSMINFIFRIFKKIFRNCPFFPHHLTPPPKNGFWGAQTDTKNLLIVLKPLHIGHWRYPESLNTFKIFDPNPLVAWSWSASRENVCL